MIPAEHPLGLRRLTARQQLCLDIISISVKERGYPPTVREIAHKMQIRSTNGVTDHLRALERKGYIAHSHETARGISVIDVGAGPLAKAITSVPVSKLLAIAKLAYQAEVRNVRRDSTQLRCALMSMYLAHPDFAALINGDDT